MTFIGSSSAINIENCDKLQFYVNYDACFFHLFIFIMLMELFIYYNIICVVFYFKIHVRHGNLCIGMCFKYLF
jgi:hypothetical protein